MRFYDRRSPIANHLPLNQIHTMEQAKAITVVDTGRSYDVSDEHEFQGLLKKLGVEDIMNVETKRIPGGFKSLKDGGEYTVKIPATPIPVNISINDQRSNPEQASNSSASTKNPDETEDNSREDDSSEAKPTPKETVRAAGKQKQGIMTRSEQKQGIVTRRNQPKRNAKIAAENLFASPSKQPSKKRMAFEKLNGQKPMPMATSLFGRLR